MSANPMRTLVEHARRNAESFPDKPFLIFWHSGAYQVITHGDFSELAASLGRFFERRATQPKGLVFLVLQHHPLLHAAFVGCMMNGSIPAYLPYPTVKQDPVLYFESHRELFARTQPGCVVTYASLIPDLLRVLPPGTQVIDIDAYRDEGPLDRSAPPSLDSVALLQHSSGTTGLKKGVALTYRQIAAQAAAYAPSVALTANAVVVSWLPLYHDMGLFTSFLIPLATGSTIVSMDAFEWVKTPQLMLQLIELFGGTHTWLPNFAFNHMVNATALTDSYDLRSMQAFISCSEPVKPATLRRFVERFEPCGVTAEKVQACYAMAEASFAITQHAIDRPARIGLFDRRSLGGQDRAIGADRVSDATVEIVSNGAPIAGVTIGILSPSGIATAEPDNGLVGEIVIKGEFVFDHYHRNPEATQAAFVDGWYKTGDIGFIAERELYICGRTKELVIVHGRNYYLHDIEEIVSATENVIAGRAVAIAVERPDAGTEEVMILAETAFDPAAEDFDERLKALRRDVKRAVFTQLELMPWQVDFVPRAWLVKTTSGKLSRVENLRRYRDSPPQLVSREVAHDA